MRDRDYLMSTSSSGMDDDLDADPFDTLDADCEDDDEDVILDDTNGLDTSDTLHFFPTEENDAEMEKLKSTPEYQVHVKQCSRNLKILLLLGFGLIATTVGLLIILPLYQKQLELQCDDATAYGSILFIIPITTILLGLVLYLSSLAFNWKIKLRSLSAIPIKRFLIICLCCGVASTLCIVCSFKRVSCHLQDPLKGAALVSALVFYFMFCRRVMALQKVFAATTGIVGIFICVDYGLCDEFRCHGNEIPKTTLHTEAGWQGSAFWSLAYAFSIILWTLHLSLIEGELIVMSSQTNKLPPPNNLLKTISRLVSDSKVDNPQTERIHKKALHKKPQPLQLAFWIHLISSVFIVFLGLIDILPSSGLQMKPFQQFWKDSGSTFLCHSGISQYGVRNLTRNERINGEENVEILLPNFNIQNNEHFHRNKRILHLHNSSSSEIKHHPKTVGHGKLIEHEHFRVKLTPEQKLALKKYKNRTISLSPDAKISLTNVNNTSCNCTTIHAKVNIVISIRPDRLSIYVWVLIIFYIIFLILLLNFLTRSESAVFTAAILNSALPMTGIIWSIWKLNVTDGVAQLLFAPSITGELICSLLGFPIVLIAIVILYKSHYNETLRPSNNFYNTVIYPGTTEA